MFADRAAELLQDWWRWKGARRPARPSRQARLGDARDLSVIRRGSVKLVVSSPPYAGTYDYAAQHDVRFTWLDLPRKTFRKVQMGARHRQPGR